MFMHKVGSHGNRKVIDFGLLNAHTTSTEANYPGTLATAEKVPYDWKIFTYLDLVQGYFYITICGVLQKLFSLKWRERAPSIDVCVRGGEQVR